MTFVRNLVRDIVERRLWPVVVLLVAGLVAVPVVLGGAGDVSSAPEAPVATPATGSTTGGKAQLAGVTVDTSAPERRDRGGKVRNPFKEPKSPKAKTPSAQTTTATSQGAAGVSSVASRSAGSATSSSGSQSSASASPQAGSGASTSTGSTGSSTSTPKTTPKTTAKKTTTPAKPKAVDATDTYHVSLRFGVDGKPLKTLADVARLSPLPSETDPFFVFLGVLRTEKTHEQRAVFIVSSDATPTGEGSCHPTAQDCETVELAKGQTVFFDYTAPDGTPTQYQLELVGIHKTQITSAAKAQAAIARHSAVGQELLRDAATRNDRAAAGARAYRFIPATGLLVRAKRAHVTAKAAAAGTLIPGLALVDRKDQPGIPVWHSPKKHARIR